MILAFDIGNTAVTVGAFVDDDIQEMFNLSSDLEDYRKPKYIEDVGFKIKQVLQIKKLNVAELEGIAICSVVPELTDFYYEMSKRHFDCQIWVLDETVELGMTVDVDEPSQVGPDRLANAVAVKEIYGYPAIVVDLGTATTFDVVDSHGNYCGGVIAPGVETSSADLFRKAARLFEIEIEKPPAFIGKNTVDAMKSGIYYGAVGQIDYILRNIINEMGVDAVKVIATGGLAELIAPESDYIRRVDKSLTLVGIYTAYKMNPESSAPF